ncbi:Serine/threonine protein kinase [Candidatus Sulfopaludibacter sp. SbA4]|nr:Serine/threonine protein kinase [Candidatus Sulfopaludibacter sp. SbA4]
MSPPSTIAHYRITGKLGEGGMGAVYRATDTKLNRDVAIKILPDSFAEDPDRLARFTREAQVLASLNHPNIAAIYGIEQNAIVMELVEGQDLQGPLPVETALNYARQIADALEAAHEKGIVHRDLKPANIKISGPASGRPDGVVKVLDFGLAKIADEATADNSATLTMRATQVGVIMGTPAYMSPEQARGQTVDRRADIWSFGVVLFEMLTGKPMFGGETMSDTLAAVLKNDPDLKRLPPETPAAIRRLLARCLERDRRKRLQAIGEARIAIEECQSAPAEVVPPAAASRRPWPWIAATAVLAVLLAVLTTRQPRESRPAPEQMKASIVPPEGATIERVALSPDGAMLAFIGTDSSGGGQLWVRRLDSLTALKLSTAGRAFDPFWSPDSRSIAFFDAGKLRRVAASGGPVQAICDAPFITGGTWNHDGTILFGPGSILFRVPSDGGQPIPVTAPNESRKDRSAKYPWFLPDGKHFLYTMYGLRADQRGIYVGSLDAAPEQNSRIRLLEDVSNAVFVPDPPEQTASGYLLFGRGSALFAQRFDAAKLRLQGSAFPVADHVGRSLIENHLAFSASAGGVLVYTAADSGTILTWFDRAGKRLGTIGEAAFQRRVRISPDQQLVMFDQVQAPASTYDLWKIPAAGGAVSRFTFNEGLQPLWSPDSARVAYEGAYTDIHAKGVGDMANEEVLRPGTGVSGIYNLGDITCDWSPDGRFLLYTARATGKARLEVIPLAGDHKPQPAVESGANEGCGAFSPDGKWVAYSSDASGRAEVYVQPFPMTGSGIRRWQVSYTGGTWPRWRRDGKELFYLDDAKNLVAVEVKTGAGFEAGTPRALFATGIFSLTLQFDVTADGQRFLMPAPIAGGANVPATLITNWLEGVKP